MTQTYTITGTVHSAGQLQHFGQGGFSKRELIIVPDLGAKYPDYIPMEFHREDADKVAGLVKGDPVEVTFTLRGRQWNDRFFLSAKASDVRRLDSGGENAMDAAMPPAALEPAVAPAAQTQATLDIPGRHAEPEDEEVLF